MKIIIYGLGQRGWEFIQDIQEVLKDIEIIAVTDTYIRRIEKQSVYKLLYVEPQDIPSYVFDYIVITPEKYFDDIRQQLYSWGVTREKIKTIEEIEGKGKNMYCELCKSYPIVWKYIGEDNNIFKTKEIVGASRRRGRCPVCGSSDRERFVYHIIKKYTELLDGKKHRVLHFAPEYMLSKKLQLFCREAYITADIVPGRGDVIADITCLPFADEQFEYIICNHVMEHISEEGQAFSEMRRCLLVKGILILTVPICWEEKTYDDKEIITEKDRIMYYGQKDHVRLYGNDIVKRIERFGFNVNMYLCNEVVDEEKRKKFGFIPKDAVFLCRRMEV